MLDENSDFWGQEDFEDKVTSAIISCFESKIVKHKGAPPSDRLTEERFNMFKQAGPYISSNSRMLLGQYESDEYDKNAWAFDIENDELPEVGCISFEPSGKAATVNSDSYMLSTHIRKVSSLGKYWHKRGSGTLYEMILLFSLKKGGTTGERRFFTINNKGIITSCFQKLTNYNMYSNSIVQTEDFLLMETEIDASMTLQLLADKRHCWTITAKEKTAKVHLGCMKEEIKSLLYARSLPITETGRKRPILHLIESHKRRLRNGIEIDIVPFLKGQQTVEIGGTIFNVNPPQVLKNKVSENSRTKFFN